MKVLLVTGTARRGGAENQLTELAIWLRNSGVDCRVALVAGTGPNTSALHAAGVPWRSHGYQGFSLRSYPARTARGVAGLVRMQADIARWQPDVVHAWLPGAVIAAFSLSRAARRSRRVAAFRGQVLPADLNHLAGLYHRAIRGADAITINSPALLHDYAVPWGADPARVEFIPNAVHLPATVADVTVQPPLAVVVANFHPYKGHDVLLRALAQVHAPLRVVCYGAAGSEHTPRLRALAQELGVSDRVTFVEGLPDIRDRLPAAQFAVHPSSTEGLSNAILEELAAGLPVVACRVGGNPELITDGENGLLVPPDDPAALAAAIERLAGDPELRVRLGGPARERAGRFSWDACGQAHLELYSRLLRRPPRLGR